MFLPCCRPSVSVTSTRFFFFLFAQECNDLKRHLGMDGMQKWQRNARVRKFPNKRVDDLIAHRTSLSNRTFATKRTKFNFVCTNWFSIHYIYKRVESRFGGKRGVRGVENAECGRWGAWKMRGVESAECLTFSSGLTPLKDINLTGKIVSLFICCGNKRFFTLLVEWKR